MPVGDGMFPDPIRRFENDAGVLSMRLAALRRDCPGTPRGRRGSGRGVSGFERRLEVDEASLRGRFPEADRKGLRGFSASTAAVHDLRERAEVERGLAKIRVAVPVGGIPCRAHRGQKRSLAGAVVTDEKRERRQASRLLLAEATEVLQSQLPELTLLHVYLLTPCPAKDKPAQSAPPAWPAPRRTPESGTCCSWVRVGRGRSRPCVAAVAAGSLVTPGSASVAARRWPAIDLRSLHSGLPDPI